MPVYVIETFDGAHKYVYYANTGTCYDLDYNEQEEYLDPKFVKQRQQQRNALYNKTASSYNKRLTILLIIFSVLLIINAIFLIGQLAAGKDYIGLIYEFFGGLKNSSTHLAGIIIFSCFIGISLILLLISIPMRSSFRKEIKRQIDNETFIKKPFEERIMDKNKINAIAAYVFPIIFTSLFLCCSIAIIPLANVGANKSKDYREYNVEYFKDLENIEPFYQIKLNLSEFKGECDSTIVSIPEICNDLYVYGNNNTIKK